MFLSRPSRDRWDVSVCVVGFSWPAVAIHGDKSQQERDWVLKGQKFISAVHSLHSFHCQNKSLIICDICVHSESVLCAAHHCPGDIGSSSNCQLVISCCLSEKKNLLYSLSWFYVQGEVVESRHCALDSMTSRINEHFITSEGRQTKTENKSIIKWTWNWSTQNVVECLLRISAIEHVDSNA